MSSKPPSYTVLPTKENSASHGSSPPGVHRAIGMIPRAGCGGIISDYQCLMWTAEITLVGDYPYIQALLVDHPVCCLLL